MLGALGGAVEGDEATALEHAIEDRGREVLVVKDASPLPRPLVGGEDHRLLAEVAVVDDVEEDVGGVLTAGHVAHLIDDEDVGVGVGGQGLVEPAVLTCVRQILDELGGRGEEGLEAVLDGAVSDGHGAS